MNVVLIGFSGSGKSSVGSLVAQHLGWEFVDTDVEVERVAGKRIHQIFAEEGEAAFRHLEREAVQCALGVSSRIVSVGGGAVMDPLNRERMRTGNLVVWLDAQVDTLYRRLVEDLADEPRPMLASSDPHSRIEALKSARDPVYRETAHVVVCTDDFTVEAVARQVARHAEGRLGDRIVGPLEEP